MKPAVTVNVNVVDLVLTSSALPLIVMVYVPVGVEVVVVIERVDENVGVPVAVPSVATGQLGAVHTGPVTVVESVIDRLVPPFRVAVTVAEALLPCTTAADVGLTDKPYVNGAPTVNVNVVDRVLTSSVLPLIVIV